jgi:hypothetical protein
METRNGLVSFGLLVLLFAFSFVFGVDAIENESTLYGVMALIGFIAIIASALFLGMLANRTGEALGVYYFLFSVVSAIVFVWYLTRCGSLFGFWQP